MSTTTTEELTRVNQFDPALYARASARLPMALDIVGFKALRPGQDTMISSVLGGLDTLGILPTGCGKSACFIIPTIACEWKTLVISPLISLQRDQVQSLQRKGIRAGMVNSSNTAIGQQYINDWIRGDLDLLYCAPERLKRDDFREIMRQRKPDMVVTDEAHTASQWADGFRASYYLIGKFINEFQPKVALALTATCPPDIEKDVRRILCMPRAVKVCYFYRRTNLKLRSADFNCVADIGEIINASPGPAIVYCSTVKAANELQNVLSNYVHGEVGIYHGDLPDHTRSTQQDAFMDDEVKCVVATNAFGMGVDKANIGAVIHRNIPGTLDALTQELGRGGRNGCECQCVTFLDAQSINTQRFFIEGDNPSEKIIRRVFAVLDKHANSAGLLRMTLADILDRAFPDKREKRNGNLSAVMQVLEGAGLIARAKSHELIATVRFTDGMDSSDPKYEMLRDTIKSLPRVERQANGAYQFDLKDLVDATDRAESTIRTWLRSLSSAGLIQYVPPFVGSSTQILSRDISAIDFDRLRIKAERAETKLKQVITYCGLRDEQKHDYLEKYFRVQHQIDDQT